MAAATEGYRCRCGSDLPSFVLTVISYLDFDELPKFKLRMPVLADSTSSSGSGTVEATLCGYVAHDLECSFVQPKFKKCSPDHFYRLIYRRNNGSGGTTMPTASSAQPHDEDVDAEREERRLMATEEGRQRY